MYLSSLSSCIAAFNGVWCDSSEHAAHYRLQTQTADLGRQQQYAKELTEKLADMAAGGNVQDKTERERYLGTYG